MSPISMIRRMAVFGVAVLFAWDALAAIGTVQFVYGEVRIRDLAGTVRAAKKGDAINEGEAILTGSVASAQLKMSDGGILAIRPETELKLDIYRYFGKQDGTENAVMSLLRGGFRAITGFIGQSNRNNYQIKAGTATIGIRGTDHEPFVVLPALPGAPPPIAPPGAYDKVNVGEAYISGPLGTVNVGPNQVGYAGPSAPPAILPVAPAFFKVTPPIRTAVATPATAASATTTSTTTTEVRESAIVDNTATLAAPTTAAVATTTTTTTTTSPATTTVTQTVSGETTSGTTANLTTQTTTTSTGTSVPITQTTFVFDSNPAVLSPNFIHGTMSQKPVSGGAELHDIYAVQPQSNTGYLLNANRDLIEIRKSAYERVGPLYIAQPAILDADIKFSGGAARDQFNSSEGTVYMGRWQGGQIDVTDLATSGAVPPFSDALGSSSAHWIVALQPGNSVMSTPLAPISNVQTLLGSASYSLLAATHPTDSSGNAGTLNSASLTANFTSQTVDAALNLSFSSADAANISSRNLNITAAASNMPIVSNFFSSGPGIRPALPAGCTGASCPAGGLGYLWQMGGVFVASASGGVTTGATGNLAVMGYTLSPNPATPPGATQPFDDLIQGAAVLTTASAPAPGVSPTPVCANCAFRSQVIYPVDGTTAGSTFFASSSVPALGGTSTTPGANYVFDGSGNLVRVLTSSWNAYERGAGSQCAGSAPCLTAPGPGATTNAMLTMAGGAVGAGGATFSSSTVISGTTATERYSDSTGIRMGRYEGGTVIVQNLETDDRLTTSLTGPSGPRSVLWAVREQPTSIPISGRFDYTPTFATKPTDSFGSTNGTLLNAQLTANFTDMTVQPAVRVSINNQALGATASGVPIFPGSFGFDVSSASVTNTTTNPSAPVALQVGCAGSNCAPAPAAGGRPYGGRISGGFSGDATAGGAFFRYTFNTRFDPANPTDVATAASLSRPINDYINGLVAFSKGAQLTPLVPSGASSVATAYFSGSFGSEIPFGNHYLTSPSFTLTGGNLTSVSTDPTISFPVESESISGGTPVAGAVAVNASALAATGIVLGRYDTNSLSATINGSEEQNGAATPFSRGVLGSYHWFKGPEPFPFGFAGALTGTASYALVGYTQPTDQNGMTGSVSGSTNLAVNFDKQAVDLNMTVTMPPSTGTQSRVWTASATNVALRDFEARFNANTGGSTNRANLAKVWLNSSSAAFANGNASGGFVGSLTGAGLNGAGMTYAFAGNDPLNSNSHELVTGALAFAMSSYSPGSSANAPSGTSINLDDVWYRVAVIAGGLLPAGAYESDATHYVQPSIVGNPRVKLNTSAQPTEFDSQWSFVLPNGCTSGCSTTNLPARVSVDPTTVANVATALSTTATPASIVDTGIDQGTGIRWGRYSGGAVAVFGRIPGIVGTLLDTTNQSLHFLMTAPQAGPTQLPITGTANYVLSGNTSPTDNFGNVGTLGSATLSANFGAQTVSSSVALTVNSQNWSASVTNAPILKGSLFYADKILGGGGTQVPLAVTSTLGTSTAGTLMGAFTGTSGQGAGIAYSLNVNGSTGTTVSGVAAFRKP